MAIFITGASGRLGSSVFKLLKGAIPLVRSPKGLKNEIVTDFSVKSLKRILVDADALVHIAGSTKFWDAKELEASNVALTKALSEALPEHANFVLASSISVYGKNVYPGSDEITPIRPDSPYAISKAEAEGIVMKRKHYTILRLGPLYGPKFSDYFEVLKMIQKGTFSIIGDGKNNIPFTNVEDAARVFKQALKKRGVFVVAGKGATQEFIVNTAADLLGVVRVKRHIPYTLAFLLAKLNETFFFSKPTLTTEHISILGKHRLFNYQKAQKYLGFSETPIEKGIKHMVLAYRQQ